MYAHALRLNAEIVIEVRSKMSFVLCQFESLFMSPLSKRFASV